MPLNRNQPPPAGPALSRLHHYRFRSRWDLPVPAAAVYAALADPLRYPLWWPQVRSVRQLDAECGEMTFQSLLPVRLRVLARADREDPVAGVLQARLSGDLEGTLRWTVRPRGDAGSTLFLEQDVDLRKPGMRRLDPLLRPAFGLNHALMMRSGIRGLVSYVRKSPTPAIGLDQ